MSRLKPMRLLIAGCGDLGLRVAHLVLQNQDARVWGLRRSLIDLRASEPRLTWLSADLTRSESMLNMPQSITHILFSAAPNARTEEDYRQVYLKGLQHIVQQADNLALERVMFISSSAVFGAHEDAWIDEETPVAPDHFNGRVLVEAERWLLEFGQTRGIATLSLRLSGIYGPGRTYLLDRLAAGLAGAPTSPAHWVNRIHIEDAAAAVHHLLHIDKPAATYLVTDSTPMPMRTLYEYLAKLVDGPPPPEGAAPAMVGSKRLSNARLKATGFEFKWPDSRLGHAALLFPNKPPAQ